MEGDMTVGQLIAFNMLAMRVNAPILRIAQIWQEFQQMRVSVKRLADILDNPAEPAFKSGGTSLPDIQGKVKFEHVTFKYRQDGPAILNDVSFDAQAGEVIGVVGASGSGKTTLVKLLQRLYVPERGRVLIDGVDLALADAAWLRRQIGVVSQDSVLFNRSVRANIAFARPDMDTAHITAAAKLAGAHEFILDLPDGYETLVGERGNQLSAGQRQRIAIARALAVNPRLLILDEATNNLDYHSERIIQENMREICKGRTVIVVAHRLSAVRHAGRILTLEHGRLLENADPATLLKNGGRYAEMHRIQEEHHALA
jgi:subfamily B ATP-binding cassette protein HlyB/CyaB